MSLPSLFSDWECKPIQPLKMTILAKFIQVTDGESFDLAISLLGLSFRYNSDYAKCARLVTHWNLGF